MDAVERYLKTVASALPEEQRDDIIRELSEDIHSEIAEKENELGRALTEAEQKAALKTRGNPLLLAAGYRQDGRALVIGRQLIGPVLFPFYVKVLTFNLGLTSVVIGVIFLALQMSGNHVSVNEILSTCLLQLVIQLSAVTLIFTLVDRHMVKHPNAWDSSGVCFGAKLEKSPATEPGKRIPRVESFSVIVACAIAIVWITEVQSHPFLIFGPAAAFLKIAPIWYRMFFPIVLLNVFEIVRAIINLVRPDWVRFRDIYRVLLHIGGLFVLYYLLKAGTWVAVSANVADAADYATAANVVNQCIYYSLLLGAGLSTITLVVRITKLFRRPNRSTGSLAPTA